MARYALLGSLAAVLAAAGCSQSEPASESGMGADSVEQAAKAYEAYEGPVPGDGPPIITKAEYDALEDGMTYEEVVEAVESEGTLIKEQTHSITAVKVRVYQWQNDDLSQATLTFGETGLLARSQTGLP